MADLRIRVCIVAKKRHTQSEPKTDRTEAENIMLLKARLSSFITYAAVLRSEMENCKNGTHVTPEACWSIKSGRSP
jgi:hypothetical protein